MSPESASTDLPRFRLPLSGLEHVSALRRRISVDLMSVAVARTGFKVGYGVLPLGGLGGRHCELTRI